MSLTNYSLINLQLQNTNLKSILMEEKKTKQILLIICYYEYIST